MEAFSISFVVISEPRLEERCVMAQDTISSRAQQTGWEDSTGVSTLPSPGTAPLLKLLSCPKKQILTQGTSLSSTAGKDHHLGIFCKALGDAEKP